jgi:hypothetical protein
MNLSLCTQLKVQVDLIKVYPWHLEVCFENVKVYNVFWMCVMVQLTIKFMGSLVFGMGSTKTPKTL